MEGKLFKSFVFNKMSSFLVLISLLHISHLSLLAGIHVLLLRRRVWVSLVSLHWLLLLTHLRIYWWVVWLVHLTLLAVLPMLLLTLLTVVLVMTGLLRVVASLVASSWLVVIKFFRPMMERFVLMETPALMMALVSSEVIEIFSSLVVWIILESSSISKTGVLVLLIFWSEH